MAELPVINPTYNASPPTFGTLADFEPVIDNGKAYPDNNPKTLIGVKKPSFHAIPASSLIELGKAMANGEKKYGLYNYRDKHVSASVYFDAIMRHLLDWWDGRNTSDDTDPPVHHLGHVMACAAIVLDAASMGTLNDDRGIKGNFDSLIKENTK